MMDTRNTVESMRITDQDHPYRFKNAPAVHVEATPSLAPTNRKARRAAAAIARRLR